MPKPRIGAIYQTSSSLNSSLAIQKPKNLIHKFFKTYSKDSKLVIFTNNYAVFRECTTEYGHWPNAKVILSSHQQIKPLKFDEYNFRLWLLDYSKAICSLKDYEFILQLEDDVFINKPIELDQLDYDINGNWSDICSFLDEAFDAICPVSIVGGQGGSVLRSRFFSNIFENQSTGLHNFLRHFCHICNLNFDHYSSDIFLTALTKYFNGTIGTWHGFTQSYEAYINSKKTIQIFHDWYKDSRKHRREFSL